jgi:hypothetical protein
MVRGHLHRFEIVIRFAQSAPAYFTAENWHPSISLPGCDVVNATRRVSLGYGPIKSSEAYLDFSEFGAIFVEISESVFRTSSIRHFFGGLST